MKNVNKQIKSRERVSNHGEVFTSEREVNDMLDMVKNESDRIESRFLEPACGTGNFLKIILKRKMNSVIFRYKRSQLDFEKFSFIAISSLYGIDILKDNVSECQNNLYNVFFDIYYSIYKKKCNEDLLSSIKYVLSKNIICADALTMRDCTGHPIIFPEWTFFSGSKIKRRDYEFSELIRNDDGQMTIFDMGKEYDEERKIFIPNPINEYPQMHFMKVSEYE